MTHRFAAIDAQNDRQREIIVAMLVKGEAWLAKLHGGKGLCKYLGSHQLFNFSADLVVPQFDAELDQLVKEFQAMGWNKSAVANKLNQISEKVKQLGGHELCWC